MIVMDIQEPTKCEECPCSYWITSGEYEGQLMCNAMEFKHQTEFKETDGFHEYMRKYFIVQEDHRPENCPIMPCMDWGRGQ